MRDLRTIGVTEADFVPEIHSDLVGLIGPVDRPEDAVGPNGEKRADESRLDRKSTRLNSSHT